MTKCSQFVRELTQGSQKRSFLKANRPRFYKPNLHSPFKVSSKPQPASSPINKIEEGCFLQDKELDQSRTPFKPCFNKIKSNPCAKMESLEILDKEQHEVHETMDYYGGTIFENNFGRKNEHSLVNVVTSPNVPLKPVFKKKKCKKAFKSFEVISSCLCLSLLQLLLFYFDLHNITYKMF